MDERQAGQISIETHIDPTTGTETRLTTMKFDDEKSEAEINAEVANARARRKFEADKLGKTS